VWGTKEGGVCCTVQKSEMKQMQEGCRKVCCVGDMDREWWLLMGSRKRMFCFWEIKREEMEEEKERDETKGDEGRAFLLGGFSIAFVHPGQRNHHRQEEGANEEALERGETPQMVVRVVLWPWCEPLLRLKGEGQGD
jgi:hypothetical protein